MDPTITIVENTYTVSVDTGEIVSLVIEDIQVVSEGILGPPGPQGPQGTQGPLGLTGPAGSASVLVYDQATPAYIWTVPHNLNKFPMVGLVDSTGHQFDADVQYLDMNTLVVTMEPALACAGKVLLV
jgi:hypothetical protein